MANQYRSITPKGIESIFQVLAETDPRISSFRLGDIAQGDTKEGDSYPMVMFDLVGSRIAQKSTLYYTEWNVRLYAFTQRREDWLNVTDSFSEAHVILNDLVIRFRMEQQFKDWGFHFEQGSKVDFDYIIRTDRDDLIGVSADLRFLTPLMQCLGDFPVDALPDAGLYYSASTLSSAPYLTCAALSGCSVIQSMQASIDDLIASGGTAGASTFVQPGSNITTGGTANAPVVSVVPSPSFASVSGTSMSAATFFSGSTDLSHLIGSTFVQPGSNIFTGGTDHRPTINLADNVTLSSITAVNSVYGAVVQGGAGQFGYVSADEFYSGGTPLSELLSFENIISNIFNQDVTFSGSVAVEGGLTVSGTTVFLGGIAFSGFTSNPVLFGDKTTGEIRYEDEFTYNDATNTLSVQNLEVTNGEMYLSAIPNDTALYLAGSIVTGHTAYRYHKGSSTLVAPVLSATTIYEGSTSLADKYSPKNLSFTLSSATYTLQLTDNNRVVDMSGASAQNVVVPRNSAVAFPLGAHLMIHQSGAGQVTFSADTGVTLRNYNSETKLNGQYATASLIKKAANEWILAGNTTT